MIVNKPFSAHVGGKWRRFKPGDIIPEKTAKELGLADKPELATEKE